MDVIKDNIELHSEEVQDIISFIPGWMISWGNTIIFLLVALAVLASIFIKYPDTISSEITITTTVPPVHLVSGAEGKIEHLLVKENEYIKEGYVLAVIESTADYKDVAELKSILNSVTVDDLKGLRIDFKDYKLGDLQSNYLSFKASLDVYKLQLQLMPESQEIFAINQQISDYQSLLLKQKIQIRNFEEELQINNQDIERSKKLLDEGVLAPKDYEDKQKQVLQLNRERESLKITVDQTAIAISELNKSLVLLNIQEKQTMENLKVSLYEKYRSLLTAIEAWEKLYLIKSPIEGNISFYKYWSSNQYVKQGDEIFTIVPSSGNNSILGKLILPLKNSGKVKVGQEVNICLESYPCEEFGQLQGTVSKISLVPKEGNYAIEVKMNSLKTSYHRDLEFKQEMSGTAKIITEELRLIERVFNVFRGLKDS